MSQVTFRGTGDGSVQRWPRLAVYAVAVAIALLPLGYAYHIEVRSLVIGGFNAGAFFYVLALLPAAASIMHRVLQKRTHWMRRLQSIQDYYEFRETYPGRPAGKALARGFDSTSPNLSANITAGLLLTGVFLLVAAIADRNARNAYAAKDITPLAGIIFCGLGAYVSVLYYLGARIYANAVSSRFLTTSTLRAASTIAFGWVAVSIGLTNVLPSGSTTVGTLFLSALFFSWAIGALRKKAMDLFGAPKTDNEELPLGIIEGVDDTTADLLNEYGVATVQHLSTSDAGELCERTFLPLDRIMDWIDQAILVQAVKRNIVAMRSLNVRTATDLARVYARAQAGDANHTKVLDSLAEKTGLGGDALRAIAIRLTSDFNVRLMHHFSEGRPLETEAAAREVPMLVRATPAVQPAVAAPVPESATIPLAPSPE